MDENYERYRQLLNIYIINPQHYYVWASLQMAMIGIKTASTASPREKDFIMDKLAAAVTEPINKKT